MRERQRLAHGIENAHERVGHPQSGEAIDHEAVHGPSEFALLPERTHEEPIQEEGSDDDGRGLPVTEFPEVRPKPFESGAVHPLQQDPQGHHDGDERDDAKEHPDPLH